MRFRSIFAALSTVLLLALMQHAKAQTPTEGASKPTPDIVYFKNGQQLEGIITAESDSKITILFRGGELVLPRRRIEKIVRGERVAEAEKHANRTLAPVLPLRDEMYFI